MNTAAARRYQLPFGWVLVVAGLLQLTLFAYATAPGLAGTSDSRYYLHAAETLRTAGQLLHPDDTPYRYWPPLYPVLLSACGSLSGIRVLHGACLLGSLLLWSWLGRQVLPGWRALAAPLLLALSTPALLVGKFVWAESAFLLLFAAYAAVLWQWLRTGRGTWWVVLALLGLLLPLQRTLGLFLLLGAGVGLLGQWRQLRPAQWWLLATQQAMSAAGGLLWQWHALLAGPSRYHPSRGWSALLSSVADFGFVLGRWLVPLPSGARALVPGALWAGLLVVLFALLWPRRARPATPLLAVSVPAQVLLRPLWGAALSLVALVAALTVFAQSAAGVHDAERYASVLFGPVVVLVLAAWPGRWPRWIGAGLLAGWLLGLAARSTHVAADLRQLPPLSLTSGARPEDDGQRVGAAGQ